MPIKPFNIDKIIDEFDGTKTAYFTATKTYINPQYPQTIYQNVIESFYNFSPENVNDIELELFNVLEARGLI
jgi:hypothetical protein